MAAHSGRSDTTPTHHPKGVFISIFSPIDVRAPIQRHKQLLQKILAQGQVSHSGAIPSTPNRSGALLAAQLRSSRTPGVNVTQGRNILQSVLDRLGVVGTQHSEESSSGAGMPIPIPRPIAPPALPPAPPIPVAPASPPAPVTPSSTSPEASMPVVTNVSSSGLVTHADGQGGSYGPILEHAPGTTTPIVSAPTPVSPQTAPTPSNPDAIVTNVSSGGVLTHSDDEGGSYGPILEHAPGTTVVALGNGMYYDPSSGLVIGTPAAQDAGSAVRALVGKATPA